MMTELEAKVIEAALKSDYNYGSGYTGEATIDNPVWAFSVADGLSGLGVARPSHGGAIGSAFKKGFIGFESMEKDNDCIRITRDGFEAYRATGGPIPE